VWAFPLLDNAGRKLPLCYSGGKRELYLWSREIEEFAKREMDIETMD
jgi:hypothetical protein